VNTGRETEKLSLAPVYNFKISVEIVEDSCLIGETWTKLLSKFLRKMPRSKIVQGKGGGIYDVSTGFSHSKFFYISDLYRKRLF